MKRSSLLATAALVAFVAGTPVMVAIRLVDGVLPVQSLDVVLAGFVIGWIQICMAVIRRNDALHSLTQPRVSLRWQADNLVAQSMLGAGFPARQPVIEDDLLRIDAPLESVKDLLPALQVVSAGALGGDDHAVDDPRRIVPSLNAQPASELPEILATEEYVVARGDTFWSIAEYAFGDGRQWQIVQELNLGREVAPGVVLNESHEPRIGWSILVPLVASTVETDESGTDVSN